jgi:3-phenylpropionate/trans-cinnamate dioxygenase ferredoxin reductase subunit
MRTRRNVTIVGAGQAAARAIAALRAHGHDGAIVLAGEEDELPYERPPLSKAALFGATEPQPAILFDAQWYRSNDVELALGVRIAAIDAGSGMIRLADGSGWRADRILLATGARARPVDVAGVDPDRILTLRNVADARRLRKRLAQAKSVALVGGGFIGLEVAAGAAGAARAITVIEARPRLVERAVSPRVSALLHALHAAHGVAVKTGVSIVGARQGREEIELRLSDGSVCHAELVVAAVGALPNAELAQQAGLACGNGVEVDADCRSSSPIVWAAGDVACRHHAAWGGAVRLESWDNAQVQGAIAGRAIAASLGACATGVAATDAAATAAADPPWFWTDQYDLNLQIVGCVTDSDRTVARGDGRGADAMIFHFRGSALRGVELLAAGRDRALARKLVRHGWPLPPHVLADTGRSLKDLLNLRSAA